MNPEFYWVAVALVTIISVSRFTRLAVVDKFPPVKRVRDWYEEKTETTGWVWLALCGYCFSFWAAWPIIGLGLAAGVYSSHPCVDIWFRLWWIGNAIMAVSYLAAVFMAYDGADGED